jgi:hypothetical protein
LHFISLNAFHVSRVKETITALNECGAAELRAVLHQVLDMFQEDGSSSALPERKLRAMATGLHMTVETASTLLRGCGFIFQQAVRASTPPADLGIALAGVKLAPEQVSLVTHLFAKLVSPDCYAFCVSAFSPLFILLRFISYFLQVAGFVEVWGARQRELADKLKGVSFGAPLTVSALSWHLALGLGSSGLSRSTDADAILSLDLQPGDKVCSLRI